jgi:imidazole glycerol-phosphate synthase subunit HisH
VLNCDLDYLGARSEITRAPERILAAERVIFQPHPLLEGIESGGEFYFVHSYYPAPAERACMLGETEYAGVRFASVIARDNLAATQFHPEKSGRLGLQLLKNFITWKSA